MSSDPIISAGGLGKSYQLYDRDSERLVDMATGGERGRRFWALKDVDIDVQRGETVGIVGRNGSGKSTLLQLICGTLAPTEGTVRVGGRVMPLLELGAGFDPDFTGRENARFSAAILGVAEGAFEDRMAEIEAFAGIGEYIDRPVREYSSGMYARLAFAVAIHVDTDILIVDEILSVGDAAFQQKCLRYMRGFCDNGGTLLFVSHDDAAVRALCRRAYWLDRGRVQSSGDTDAVCRRYHAAMSKLAIDGEKESNFEMVDSGKPARRAPRNAPAMATPGYRGFHPDRVMTAMGGGRITSMALTDALDAPIAVAHGGLEVAVHAAFRLLRDLRFPAVHFALRDRFGQVIFGDTAELGESRTTERGRDLKAVFRFVLPYLPTGEYALEVMLTETVAQSAVLVAREDEPAVLSVATHHISHGLANIAMRDIRIEREAQSGGNGRPDEGIGDVD
ncbi:MAG: ABC transporter ATP-binding protein [Rhodobiaceae bacterium]|nr:ABC transporter ATP-binding protein [Rhodobiaceae bacterium]MCC0054623.1 ABC transporter ATP-binding protein [Rhodobiaceae bacterium]